MSNKVSFEDFLVEGLVQEGAWGKVFGAKRISDGVPLALVWILLCFPSNSSLSLSLVEILWVHEEPPELCRHRE